MAASRTPTWHAVVLSWNGRDETLACLASLTAVEPDPAVALICVDNGSADGSVEAIRAAHPGVTVLENGANLGFAGGNNVGIRHALAQGAEWVVLVNNDCTVAPDAFAAFERVAAQRPAAGALAGKVFFKEPPDRIWFAGARFKPAIGYSGRLRGYRRRDAPRYGRVEPTERASGAFVAVSREAIERVGLLDEELFAYAEDAEWSLRIREAGFEVLFVPEAHAWHTVSASTGGERGSTNSLYYSARNMIRVGERHRPHNGVGTWLRRLLVLATFSLQAALRPNRHAALAAVWQGCRDAAARKGGERP